MKIMLCRLMVFTIMIMLVCSTVYAQFGSDTKTSTAKTEDSHVIKITIEGIQVVEDQDNGSGTKASDADYKYFLKIIKAIDQDGKELIELQGLVLPYVETLKSKNLIKKYGAGEKLVFKGKLLIRNREKKLEVDSLRKASSSEPGTEPKGSDSKM